MSAVSRYCSIVLILAAGMLWGGGVAAQNAEPVTKPVTGRPILPDAVNEHSPKKALLLSLLPGAGQVYNHQAWKIPIIYGALGGIGYVAYDNYSKMSQFKEEYLYRVYHDDTPQLEGYEDYPTTNIYNLYESYNRDFQLFVFIGIGVYALNLIDAYVFGHLYDFEISDDLTLYTYPALNYQPTTGLVPGMGVTLRF